MNDYARDSLGIGPLFSGLMKTAGYTNRTLADDTHTYLGLALGTVESIVSTVKHGYLYYNGASFTRTAVKRLTEISFLLLVMYTPPNHEIIQRIITADPRFEDIHPITSLNGRKLEDILTEIKEKRGLRTKQ